MEEDRNGDTNTVLTWQTAFCARAAAMAKPVLAEVVPSCCHSTFCFLLKQGHSRRCKYRSAAPRISGKAASEEQPSCSSSRGVHIHRKQNLQHILMWLNARSKSHL